MRMSAPNSGVVSDLEVQAMKVLPDFVPPGERVLNDRGDGSAWMFAIAGILPVAGHYNAGQIGPDADLLAGRFNEYDNDPAVRAAVARLGIKYVIVDRGYNPSGLSPAVRTHAPFAECTGWSWSTRIPTRRSTGFARRRRNP